MKIYNTLSAQKEDFKLQGDEVKMYVCGVTPYADSHIGHAMSYVIFDVVRRYLKYRGYKVKYVQNITDIDDKIINRANQLGISTSELAGKYSKNFYDDMAALNISRPDETPKATEEVPKILEVIQGLVDKGYAYAANGSVYFRVRNMADYGKLSHRTLDMMEAGARIEPGEEKEHPMDFVLWKAAKPDEPSWDSPWGKGRPGWHIECSAMSLKYLGETLDIHGGGQDLIFPHHENEIAQSESFTGKKPFVKYWMHNGLLQLGGEKMSKSIGNLITIREILQKHSADALRIFILSSHYRSPLSYSAEVLDASEKGAERLTQAAQVEPGEVEISKAKVVAEFNPEQTILRFKQAMDNDFNTPQALAALFDLAKEINIFSDSGSSVYQLKKTLAELAGVLGLTLRGTRHYHVTATAQVGITGNVEVEFIPNLAPFRSLANSIADELAITRKQDDKMNKALVVLSNTLKQGVNPNDARGYIDWLIKARRLLRDFKDFQTADNIRKTLTELGVTLEDTPSGTTWKYKKAG